MTDNITLIVAALRRGGFGTAADAVEGQAARIEALEAERHDLAGRLNRAITARERAERELRDRELHHFEEEQARAAAEARIAQIEATYETFERQRNEAEQERDAAHAVIAEVRAMLPGPRTFAESLARDHAGNLWPRTIDADEVARILSAVRGDVLREHDERVKADAVRWALDGALPALDALWNVSQHDRMVIDNAGVIQEAVESIRCMLESRATPRIEGSATDAHA